MVMLWDCSKAQRCNRDSVPQIHGALIARLSSGCPKSQQASLHPSESDWERREREGRGEAWDRAVLLGPGPWDVSRDSQSTQGSRNSHSRGAGTLRTCRVLVASWLSESSSRARPGSERGHSLGSCSRLGWLTVHAWKWGVRLDPGFGLSSAMEGQTLGALESQLEWGHLSRVRRGERAL